MIIITSFSNTTGSSVSHLTTGINTHVTLSSHITSSNQIIITCTNTQDDIEYLLFHISRLFSI